MALVVFGQTILEKVRSKPLLPLIVCAVNIEGPVPGPDQPNILFANGSCPVQATTW